MLGGDYYQSLKNYQYSTEGQKFHQNLAPVLVIILWNSLVFSRKIITSTDFYRYLRPRQASTSSGKKSVSHINEILPKLFWNCRLHPI